MSFDLRERRRERIAPALLLAGFYYSYACSVMLGLGQTDDRTFLSAMQAINASVRNAAFAPAFFGSLVLTATAAIIMVARRRSGAPWVVLAALLYAASFVVTLTLNVPLNEALAAAGPVDEIADPAGVRLAFEGPWVSWNLLRTLLAMGSLLALAVALLSTEIGRVASAGFRSVATLRHPR